MEAEIKNQGSKQTDSDKVTAKEERKALEMQAMRDEDEKRVRSWTPAEAEKAAQRDAENYRLQQDDVERKFMRVDISENAKMSNDYKKALEKNAPDVSEIAVGVPLKSAKGTMYYNDQRGMAGVEIENEDGSRTGFGGKPAMKEYAAEKKLSPEDIKAMEAIDARADKYRTTARESGINKVESDEIATARQGDGRPIVPPEVEKQYLRVGDKYYHSKNSDLVAFEDKGNKLETKSNSENIAETMVRIANARGWDEIKVSGSETFRKEAWLEAASRGMHVKGYWPSEKDKAELAKRVNDYESKQVEPENKTFRAREKELENDNPKRQAQAFANETPAEAARQFPELAGAAAAAAAIEKKAKADGLDPIQQAIVRDRVRQNIVNSIERGEPPQVKIKEEIEHKRDPNNEKEYTR